MFSGLFLLLLSVQGFSDNPIIQNNYTADPAPMVYKDRVYLYTSHDDDKTEADFYTMRNYCCYSTTDMTNWTDHGIIATLKEFAWLNGHNNDAWAPQCVERNGKFYLYIPIHGKGIGVLVADSPTGPFRDPIGKQLVFRDNWSDIDPTVFIDSDGQAYMYWGNGTLWYVKLNEDMTSYSGGIVTCNPKPTGFTEGPWFYKRENLYYMIYAGMGGSNENIQYATSSAPIGPWTAKGVIMQSGTCFTNHPGVCDYKGKSYFFYHNSALPGGGTFKRSVCLETLTYKSDGSIEAMTMNKNSPDQAGTFTPFDTVEAETFNVAGGVETEVCSEGGMHVTSIENGDYIKVKGVDFGTGSALFEARVASGSSGGKIELRLGSQTGTLIGTCTVGSTGGAQNWQTKSCTVSGASGKHDLFLTFSGGSGSLFNFNWWRFQVSTGAGKTVEMPNLQTPNRLTLVSRGGTTAELTLRLPGKFTDDKITLYISDLQGRLVYSQCVPLASGVYSLPVDKGLLRPGMYMLRACSVKNELLYRGYFIKK